MSDVVANDTAIHLPDADGHADPEAGLDGVCHGMADTTRVVGRMVAVFAFALDEFKPSIVHGHLSLLCRVVVMFL